MTAFASEEQVGSDIEVVAQLGVLPHKSDTAAISRAQPRGHWAPVQQDRSIARRDVPGHAPDEGRLASPVLTGQGDQFSGSHIEVDPVKGRQRPEAHGQVANREQRSAAGGRTNRRSVQGRRT